MCRAKKNFQRCYLNQNTRKTINFTNIYFNYVKEKLNHLQTNVTKKHFLRTSDNSSHYALGITFVTGCGIAIEPLWHRLIRSSK